MVKRENNVKENGKAVRRMVKSKQDKRLRRGRKKRW
jgi:hypothetical protein